MDIFNPWLGFPARNAIYLDRSFNRQRGNGQSAFGTFQTAYDAAAALATSLAEIVVIMVGEGSAAQFGNLTITADWNSNVLLVGISKDVSILGNITATNAAGDGFAVNVKICNLSIGSITTSTSAAAGNSSGLVTITGSGTASSSVGAIDARAGSALDNGGTVTLTDLTHTTIRTDSLEALSGSIILTRTIGTTLNGRGGATATSPGNLTLTDSVVTTVALGGDSVGASGVFTATRSRGTTVNGAGTLGVGASVILTDSQFTAFDLRTNGDVNSFVATRSQFTTVDLSNSGVGSGGSFTSRDSIGTSIKVAGAAGDGIVKIYSSSLNASAVVCIDVFVNGGIINDSLLVVSGAGNISCIADLLTSTTGIILNSILIPSGTGVSIDDAAGATIFLENVQMKNDVDPLVTVNGNYTIMGNLISPL